MNLECLNGIITENLAIQIDLTKLKSWDLNTGLTAYSMSKWSGAISDNINLIDFGLTGFDNGRKNEMWNGIVFTPQDTLFSMYRVGYNIVDNPTTRETTGMTITTEYLPISGITSGDTGNYYELDGGYLQGFFKLHDYNYELLPPRYNEGITIETIVHLNEDSHGIFYLMGARAEDKYSPFFSGETITGGTSDNINVISGVTTSEDNYLDDIITKEINSKSFSNYEENQKTTINEQTNGSGNTINNVISFEITEDKRIGYKYINNNGQIVTNASNLKIDPATGWTIIAITFTPNEIFDNIDDLECAKQRDGKLVFYVNGRSIWSIDDFPEYYFKNFNNEREKQIGVPYSISWGGGSFGLKNSWHYDAQTYDLYEGDDTQYINNNFIVESNPFPGECDVFPPDIPLDGLSLSADSSTFYITDNCDPNIEHPITVMRVEYTGGSNNSQTGTSANTYFVKFNQPITVLSNRDYEIDIPIINSGFFMKDDGTYRIKNKVSVVLYGSADINIITETEYIYPLTSDDIIGLENDSEHQFPDKNEFMYKGIDGVLYYGETGLPVFTNPNYYTYFNLNYQQPNYNGTTVITGEDVEIPLKTTFSIENNSGKQIIYVGLLIETSHEFNLNEPLFIKSFKYSGQDILVQDDRKENLLVEQNFNSYFNGGIQKLRVYDNALTSQEILHNALIESKMNPNMNMLISKGGRLIYR